jgi:chromosome partitioning protein
MAGQDVMERPARAKKSRKKAELQDAARADPAAQPHRLKRVVVTSPKGGSGKTGTTRNLAVAAALDGYRVATIDLDPQRSLTRWWEKRPDEATNIDHFAAHIRDVNAVLAEVADFDLMIFDTPTSVEEYLEAMKKLIVACDLALITTQETDDDLDSVLPWMDAVRKYQRNAAFLFNRIKPRTVMFTDARNRVVGNGYQTCPVEVPDYTDIATSGNQGIGVLELRGAKGRDHMTGVWGYVRSSVGLSK